MKTKRTPLPLTLDRGLSSSFVLGVGKTVPNLSSTFAFRSWGAFLFLLLAFMASSLAAPTRQTTANSAAATGSQDNVDKNAIKELYYQGDFEPLISLLESMRSQRRIRDKEDSVFIFKYLGVLYGADTMTQRKAEAFLYQMLKLDPASGLEELMVSDQIVALFREVKQLYLKRHAAALTLMPPPGALTKEDSLELPVVSTSANASSNSSGSSVKPDGKGPLEPKSEVRSSPGPLGIAPWKWVAGGAVVAAATVGTVLLMNQEPDPEVTRISSNIE
jgi:hypothetical protein